MKHNNQNLLGNYYYKKILNDLPVFLVGGGKKTVLFTTGHVNSISPDEIQHIDDYLKQKWCSQSPPDSLEKSIRIAEKNQISQENSQNNPFKPLSLHIEVARQCQLNCSYCFLKKNTNYSTVDIEVVKNAAELAASYCRECGVPFMVVFNNGGEPTFHWDIFVKCVECVRDAGEKHKVTSHVYLSTNGCLTESQLEWITQHVDEISLSCDGPPGLNVLSREKESSKYVEQCADFLNSLGKPFRVRSTITENTESLQKDIAEYIIHRLMCRTISFCLEYLRRANYSLKNAASFFGSFIEAEQYISHFGGTLEFPHVRINEIHGPYCQSARNVLHLTSDNEVNDCMFGLDNQFKRLLGKSDTEFSEIYTELTSLKQKSLTIPEFCNDCINSLNCSRGCPDRCVFGSGLPQENMEPTCILYQTLACYFILNGKNN